MGVKRTKEKSHQRRVSLYTFVYRAQSIQGGKLPSLFDLSFFLGLAAPVRLTVPHDDLGFCIHRAIESDLDFTLSSQRPCRHSSVVGM